MLIIKIFFMIKYSVFKEVLWLDILMLKVRRGMSL
jgi:hypothetical protein